MIADEAVEAAYARVGHYLDDTEAESWREILREALEAAAPGLMAGAWRAGYEYGYEDGHCEKDGILFPEPENPYRNTK